MSHNPAMQEQPRFKIVVDLSSYSQQSGFSRLNHYLPVRSEITNIHISNGGSKLSSVAAAVLFAAFFPNLQFLSVTFQHRPNTKAGLAPARFHHPNGQQILMPELRHLSLSGLNLEPTLLAAFLAIAPNLETFEVSGAWDVSQLPPDQWKRLRRLRVRGVMADGVARTLLASPPEDDFDDTGFECCRHEYDDDNAAADIKCDNMQSLCIGPASWGSELSELVQQRCRDVRRLDLITFRNALTDREQRSISMQSLAKHAHDACVAAPYLRNLTIGYHLLHTGTSADRTGFNADLFDDTNNPWDHPLETLAVDMSIIRDEGLWLDGFDAMLQRYEITLGCLLRALESSPRCLRRLRRLVLGFDCGAPRPVAENSPNLQALFRMCQARRIVISVPSCWEWLRGEYVTSQGPAWTQCHCQKGL